MKRWWILQKKCKYLSGCLNKFCSYWKILNESVENEEASTKDKELSYSKGHFKPQWLFDATT